MLNVLFDLLHDVYNRNISSSLFLLDSKAPAHKNEKNQLDIFVNIFVDVQSYLNVLLEIFL